MNTENLNRMFTLIVMIIIGGIGFFCGRVFDINNHELERNQLIFERDSIEGYADHFTYNADFHAMFNYKAKEVTAGCRPCTAKLTTVQNNLDSIETYKGLLVVPNKYRNPTDRLGLQPIHKKK